MAKSMFSADFANKLCCCCWWNLF